MSEITILTICETDPRFCDSIAGKLDAKTLYEVVADDWRRPIVDGILASVYYYGLKDPDMIKSLLVILGYRDLARALAESEAERTIEYYKKRIERIMKELEEEIRKYEKLIKP